MDVSNVGNESTPGVRSARVLPLAGWLPILRFYTTLNSPDLKPIITAITMST